MPAERSERRLVELDAVRGIAALVVVLGHWLALAPGWDGDGSPVFDALRDSPLRLPFAASEAVLVFFVLSGFVLALAAPDARDGGYGRFLVRRAFRLYPALWLALAGGSVLALLRGWGPVDGQSLFVNAAAVAPHPFAVAGHADLLRADGSLTIDPVVWSLVHELRLSLVFPLLVTLAAVLGPLRAFGLSALVSVLLLHAAHGAPGLGVAGTGAYAACFMGGLCLARERERIRAWVATRPAAEVRLAWLAAWLLLTSPYTLAGEVPAFFRSGGAIVAPAIGAGLVIVLAQQAYPARVLSRAAPLFLGRISYSLYLWHVPILLLLARTLGRDVAPLALAPVGIAVTIGVAALSERLVEAPAIRLGRRIAGLRRAEPRPAAATRAAVSSAP